MYKLYQSQCKEFYKLSEKCGIDPAYVYGTKGAVKTLVPYLCDVRRGVAEKFYEKHHHEVCALGYECPKKICPELKLAAYYCTTTIVSRRYFSEEVV